jgi:hypothetical protein
MVRPAIFGCLEKAEYGTLPQRMRTMDREMGSVTAVFRNGRIELAEAVDWPDGTRVEVTPLGSTPPRISWLSLPPLDVGEFRGPSAEDDLLGEMLDDARA